jgi:hypothetical protein
LFPHRLHEELYELGLNSDHFIEVLDLAQLPYKVLSRARFASA